MGGIDDASACWLSEYIVLSEAAGTLLAARSEAGRLPAPRAGLRPWAHSWLPVRRPRGVATPENLREPASAGAFLVAGYGAGALRQ